MGERLMLRRALILPLQSGVAPPLRDRMPCNASKAAGIDGVSSAYNFD